MKGWPIIHRTAGDTPAPVQASRQAMAKHHFAFLLALAGVVLYLTLSDNMLVTLGIPYNIPGGSFLAKIHPGSYLVATATVLLLVPGGQTFNPLLFMMAFVRRARPLFLFQLTILVMLGYSIINYGPSGSAFIIESFLIPMMLAFVLEHARQEERAILFHVILALMLLNAAIGLVEYLTQSRLVPYMAGDQEIIETHFRATALGGHPLSNAHHTTLFLASLLVWSHRRAIFWIPVGVLMIALFAFGSRTAMVLALLLYTGWGLRTVVANFSSGKMEYRGILLTLMAMVVIPGTMAGAVFALGLGERIFATFYWDESAQSRLMAFLAFSYVSTEDLLFGLSPGRIEQILLFLKMSTTLTDIENFWILMILQFGVILFLLFCLTFLNALRHMAQGGGAPLWATTLLFLILVSSNNSLAVKSQEFVILVAILYGARGMLRQTTRQEEPAGNHPAFLSESRRQTAAYSRLPRWIKAGSGSLARQ